MDVSGKGAGGKITGRDDASVSEVQSPGPHNKQQDRKKRSSRAGNKHSADEIVGNPQFLIPFEHGWRREVVIRNTDTATGGGKGSADIYYCSPTGKKLRSLVQIGDYLKTSSSSEVEIGSFTFYKGRIHCEPAEVVRQAVGKARRNTGDDVVRQAGGKARRNTGDKQVQEQKKNTQPQEFLIPKRPDLLAELSTPKQKVLKSYNFSLFSPIQPKQGQSTTSAEVSSSSDETVRKKKRKRKQVDDGEISTDTDVTDADSGALISDSQGSSKKKKKNLQDTSVNTTLDTTENEIQGEVKKKKKKHSLKLHPSTSVSVEESNKDTSVNMKVDITDQSSAESVSHSVECSQGSIKKKKVPTATLR